MVQQRASGSQYGYDSNGTWNSSIVSAGSHNTMASNIQEQVPQLLTQEMIEFKITVPCIGISAMSLEYMYEIATRLLFLTVDWGRKMPFFNALANEDQLTLLQSTWRDLFLLGIGQCSSSFPLSPLLTLASGQLKSEPDENSPNFNNIIGHIMNVKDFVHSLERLDLDTTEYAHMKVIALCNPDFPGLVDPKKVAEVQEKAHNALRVYIKNKDPNNTGRFAKLLLRLPATRVIDSLVIEQLFFAPLIGDVHIENIMANIMNNTFRI